MEIILEEGALRGFSQAVKHHVSEFPSNNDFPI